MPGDLEHLLREAIESELPQLRAFSPGRSAVAPRPGAWSPREELGHLIDSATNNHIRFVVSSTAGEFRGPGYAQDDWVAAHAYRDVPWDDLVELWYRYNCLLAQLVGHIPENRLQNRCVIDSTERTLGYVIEDYVLHMQHHLDHLLGRESVRQYPAATDPTPSVSR